MLPAPPPRGICDKGDLRPIPQEKIQGVRRYGLDKVCFLGVQTYELSAIMSLCE